MSKREWPAAVRHLPVCPKRDLPIPYIAEIAPDGHGEFTILDDRRARECLEGRLCAMCGLPMGWWVALIGDPVSVDEPDGGLFIEPPVHEECAELALGGLCPYLSRERVPRRMPQEDVAIAGMTPEEVFEVGRTVAKRPLIMAICHDYYPDWQPSLAGSPIMMYRPGKIVRVRRFGYADGRLAECPAAAPAAAAARVIRTQRRRGRR